MNPALPPTFGIKGPIMSLMRVAANTAARRSWRFGMISGDAIPTNAPQYAGITYFGVA